MLSPSAHPISEIILVDLLVPPIGSCFWWVMSRKSAMAAQGGEVSETTRNRQKSEFWVIVASAYLLTFGISCPAWARKPQVPPRFYSEL